MPEAVTITGVTCETPSVQTFSFDRSFSFKAGQFVMVWVPGVDEIPMALSAQNEITVQKVGDATSALFRLGKGDSIALRGPLGNGFEVSGRTLAVAGGVGAAPLRPLAMAGMVDTFLLGARTAGELVYSRQLAVTTDLHISTDDGTAGHHGFVTDLFEDLDLDRYEHICVCGPEVMMRAILGILDSAGCAEKGQFSLQRYMKCGVGLCGSCCIDPSGLRVCKDGPVFTGDILLNSEFGRHARDASGRKIPF